MLQPSNRIGIALDGQRVDPSYLNICQTFSENVIISLRKTGAEHFDGLRKLISESKRLRPDNSSCHSLSQGSAGRPGNLGKLFSNPLTLGFCLFDIPIHGKSEHVVHSRKGILGGSNRQFLDCLAKLPVGAIDEAEPMMGTDR